MAERHPCFFDEENQFDAPRAVLYRFPHGSSYWEVRGKGYFVFLVFLLSLTWGNLPSSTALARRSRSPALRSLESPWLQQS
jgi:hypothetical protein